jgi:hypothetical protein
MKHGMLRHESGEFSHAAVADVGAAVCRPVGLIVARVAFRPSASPARVTKAATAPSGFFNSATASMGRSTKAAASAASICKALKAEAIAETATTWLLGSTIAHFKVDPTK